MQRCLLTSLYNLYLFSRLKKLYHTSSHIQSLTTVFDYIPRLYPSFEVGLRLGLVPRGETLFGTLGTRTLRPVTHSPSVKVYQSLRASL